MSSLKEIAAVYGLPRSHLSWEVLVLKRGVGFVELVLGENTGWRDSIKL